MCVCELIFMRVSVCSCVCACVCVFVRTNVCLRMFVRLCANVYGYVRV